MFVCLLFLRPACLGHSQALGQSGAGTQSADSGQRIRLLITELNAREVAGASNRELGYRWTVLGFEYSNGGEFTNSENAYNRALDLLGRDPADAGLDAAAIDQLGALYRVLGKLTESMNCFRKALALRLKLGDPLLIAVSRGRMAEDEVLARRYREAMRDADEAYRFLATAEEAEMSDRISALLVRAYAECGLRRRAECLMDAQQALALSRSGFPERSPEVAGSLMALSVAQLRNGSAAEAEESVREAIGTLKLKLSADDPRVVYALVQERDCLVALHRKEEARQVEAQVEAGNRRYSESCAGCTVSAFGLTAPSH